VRFTEAQQLRRKAVQCKMQDVILLKGDRIQSMLSILS